MLLSLFTSMVCGFGRCQFWRREWFFGVIIAHAAMTNAREIICPAASCQTVSRRPGDRLLVAHLRGGYGIYLIPDYA
jgi:hypothetical protein